MIETKNLNIMDRKELAELVGMTEVESWKYGLNELRSFVAWKREQEGKGPDVAVDPEIEVKRITQHFAIPAGQSFPMITVHTYEAAEQYLVDCGKKRGEPIGGRIMSVQTETVIKEVWK